MFVFRREVITDHVYPTWHLGEKKKEFGTLPNLGPVFCRLLFCIFAFSSFAFLDRYILNLPFLGNQSCKVYK